MFLWNQSYDLCQLNAPKMFVNCFVDVAIGEECRYLGHCTFAYCQEEIDVWTLERKGFICRDNLCDPYGFRPKINLTVPKILQEDHGIFMFLCEVHHFFFLSKWFARNGWNDQHLNVN